MLDATTISGRDIPLYFGPLSGYDTSDANKKKTNAKGFRFKSFKKKETRNNPPALPPKYDSVVVKDNNQVALDIPTWDDFTQATTFHGVRYIFDKTPIKIRRILWCLVVAAAIATFVGQVGSRIAVFFQRRTNVDVEVNYVEEIEFPSVTICNQNNYRNPAHFDLVWIHFHNGHFRFMRCAPCEEHTGDREHAPCALPSYVDHERGARSPNLDGMLLPVARTTSTVKWGLYNFIDEIFSASNITGVDLSPYNLTVDTSEFVLQTAHQKEDLIDRCTWKSKQCNINENFTTTVTDLGVCYTFNGKIPSLRIEEPGTSTGLSLVLNVEQYEYMRGPQNDAGVKIHLHHQGETPQMKDQGFAVAPGTHTLVGVKRYQVRSLSKPYGKCEAINPVPVSECQLKCKTEKVFSACGCHDVHMKPYESENTTSELCDMRRKFICAHVEIEKLTHQPTDCKCPVPCRRVYYKPELSYAQLSRLNVDRLIIADEDKRNLLQSKFHDAMETSQGVVKEIHDADKEKMERLLGAIKHLEEVLNDTHPLIQNFSKLAQRSKAPNILTENIVEDDERKILDIIENKTSTGNVRGPYPRFYFMWDGNVKYMERAMALGNQGTTSKTLDFLLFCNGTLEGRWVDSENSQNDDIPVTDDVSGENDDTTATSEIDSETIADDSTTEENADTVQTEMNTETQGTIRSDMQEEKESTTNSNENLNFTASVPTTISKPTPTEFDYFTVPVTTMKFDPVETSVPINDPDRDLSTTTNPQNDLDVLGPPQPDLDSDPGLYPWTNVKDISECPSAFGQMKDMMDGPLNDLEENCEFARTNPIQYKFWVYRDQVRDIFENGSLNVSSPESHELCEEVEGEYSELDDTVKLTLELGLNITRARTYDEAFRYASQIPALHRKRVQFSVNEDDYWTKYAIASYDCEWLRRDAEDTIKKAQMIRRDFEIYQNEREAALRQLGILQELFDKLYTEIIYKIKPAVNLATNYSQGSITKLYLAMGSRAPSFRKALEDVDDFNKELTEVTKEFTKQMINGKDKLIDVYEKAFESKYPILNKFTIFQLGFVNIAASINDTLMQNLVTSLEDNMQEGMNDMIKETVLRLVTPIEDMRDTIVEPIDDILSQIAQVVDDLAVYTESTKMNTEFFMENFMQLDIFYQELSYEQIEQNIAFEFLSLLSEVGGFLGLFLGASILTVCELVDYISLHCFNRFYHSNNTHEPPHTKSESLKVNVDTNYRIEKLRSWW